MSPLMLGRAAVATDLDVCPTCTYTTIQSAIDAAGPGDRIRIAQGTYHENLDIGTPKTITLSGGWDADCVGRRPLT
jgi:pectin methylesterase-like acyl-CoA thioesterase